MAGILDFSLDNGSRFRTQIVAKDTLGSPLNLSGYAARGVVRNRFSSSGILIDLNPQVDTSYISGIITIDLPASGVAAIPFGSHVYDIEIYTSESNAYKILKGKFLVSPEVTT